MRRDHVAALWWSCRCAVLALMMLPAFSAAQGYPARAIRVVVPYAPGGGLDTVGRPVTQKLSETFGQPVILENRPGGGTTIGTSAVAKAAPDGYTLLLTLSAFAISPSLYPQLPYDPLKDFVPVSWVATSSYILAVHPAVPARSVKDLLALAKAKAGSLNYSSPGVGTDPHMAMELLQSLSGVTLNHVPYNGGGPAATAAMGGHVDLLFLPTSVGTPFVQAGKLRGIAVSTPRRSTLMPDLPTVAESGISGFAAEAWSGILAPAGTPTDVIAKLNANIVRIVRTPEMRTLLASRMVEPVGSSAEQFAERLRADVAKWKKLVADRRIRLD
ncbi:MAG: transporter [Betaproteobacteria bacterium]|nr:transporter [Betaproteobacteria bacterium]